MVLFWRLTINLVDNTDNSKNDNSKNNDKDSYNNRNNSILQNLRDVEYRKGRTGPRFRNSPPPRPPPSRLPPRGTPRTRPRPPTSISGQLAARSGVMLPLCPGAFSLNTLL